MKVLETILLLMVMTMLSETCLAEELTYLENTTWKGNPVYILNKKKLDELFNEASLIPTEEKVRSVKAMLLKNSVRLLGNKTYLDELAEAFYRVSVEYKIPANVLQAIAFVESSYILNAINSGSNDFGIMQINEFNIRAYSFNKQRLLTDVRYSVEAGAIVFKWFYSRYPLDQAIKRYNCGTRKGCVNYKSVKKYLDKIKGAM